MTTWANAAHCRRTWRTCGCPDCQRWAAELAADRAARTDPQSALPFTETP